MDARAHNDPVLGYRDDVLDMKFAVKEGIGPNSYPEKWKSMMQLNRGDVYDYVNYMVETEMPREMEVQTVTVGNFTDKEELWRPLGSEKPKSEKQLAYEKKKNEKEEKKRIKEQLKREAAVKEQREKEWAEEVAKKKKPAIERAGSKDHAFEDFATGHTSPSESDTSSHADTGTDSLYEKAGKVPPPKPVKEEDKAEDAGAATEDVQPGGRRGSFVRYFSYVLHQSHLPPISILSLAPLPTTLSLTYYLPHYRCHDCMYVTV